MRMHIQVIWARDLERRLNEAPRFIQIEGPMKKRKKKEKIITLIVGYPVGT